MFLLFYPATDVCTFHTKSARVVVIIFILWFREIVRKYSYHNRTWPFCLYFPKHS
jgi:hypothetical protein